MALSSSLRNVQLPPDEPFTIVETQDKEISKFYVVQECPVTDLEAPRS